MITRSRRSKSSWLLGPGSSVRTRGVSHAGGWTSMALFASHRERDPPTLGRELPEGVRRSGVEPDVDPVGGGGRQTLNRERDMAEGGGLGRGRRGSDHLARRISDANRSVDQVVETE